MHFTFDLEHVAPHIKCGVEAAAVESEPDYRDRSDWWHKSRSRPMMCRSISEWLGIPLIIASLVFPRLARAFLPFMLAMCCIGCIEGSAHLVARLRVNESNLYTGNVCIWLSIVVVHIGAFVVSCWRGWGADTPVVVSVICSTCCHVIGIGIVIVVDEWWYRITPAQMILLLASLHPVGILLLFVVP